MSSTAFFEFGSTDSHVTFDFVDAARLGESRKHAARRISGCEGDFFALDILRLRDAVVLDIEQRVRGLLVHAGERLDLCPIGRAHRQHHRDILKDELRLAGYQCPNALDRAAALQNRHVEALFRVESVFQRGIIRGVPPERNPVELERDLFGRRFCRPGPHPHGESKAHSRARARRRKSLRDVALLEDFLVIAFSPVY